MFRVNYIVNHIFNSRTYILSDDSVDKIWLIDCGDIEKVYPIIGRSIIEGVLLTHTHSDHIYGLNSMLERFPGARIVTNAYGYDALISPRLNISRYQTDLEDFILSDRSNIDVVSEGQQIDLLNQSAIVFETLGHDPSCLCYRVGNFFFTGDAYIPGLKVVTSFPFSDKAEAQASLSRISAISAGLQICPGH